MPYKNPADKAKWSKIHRRNNRAHYQAKDARGHKRDRGEPGSEKREAYLARYREYRKDYRSRVILRELGAQRPPKAEQNPILYTGTLKPRGF